MGIFQFKKKEKQTALISEQETVKNQPEETQEDVTTFLHDLNLVPEEYRKCKIKITNWQKADGDIVKTGDPLFELEIKKEYGLPVHASVAAQFDGLLEILKKSSNDLVYPEYLTKGEKVFRIYKEPFEQKFLELKNKRFLNLHIIKTDIFKGLKEIRWERVAGREKTLYDWSGIYDSFIFFSDDKSGNKLIFTLNSLENKDFIVFRYPTKDYKLIEGSKISFYFSNSDIDQFDITNKPYKHSDNSNWGLIFETKVQLTVEELENLKTKGLSGWRIEFPQIDKKISGVIDSSDTQFSINKLAKEYYELVKTEIINYQPLYSRQITNEGRTFAKEECYVYLMVDLTNNYHKIGISNKPEIREKTLQSEKPTIEMICHKHYPIRKIANILEQTLHQTYANKRVRGEWFNLSEKDIQEIKEVLK